MQLSDVFQFTESLIISKLTPTIDKIHVWWYILFVSQLVLVMLSMLACECATSLCAKIAVVHSRLNKNRSSGTHCVTLFKAKVISRVNAEYQFASFQNKVCNFFKRWNTYNVLCKVENHNIVFYL